MNKNEVQSFVECSRSSENVKVFNSLASLEAEASAHEAGARNGRRFSFMPGDIVEFFDTGFRLLKEKASNGKEYFSLEVAAAVNGRLCWVPMACVRKYAPKDAQPAGVEKNQIYLRLIQSGQSDLVRFKEELMGRKFQVTEYVAGDFTDPYDSSKIVSGYRIWTLDPVA